MLILSYENEISLTCKLTSFSYERMSTKTRFEEEAKGNSEVAYYGGCKFSEIKVQNNMTNRLKFGKISTKGPAVYENVKKFDLNIFSTRTLIKYWHLVMVTKKLLTPPTQWRVYKTQVTGYCFTSTGIT